MHRMLTGGQSTVWYLTMMRYAMFSLLLLPLLTAADTPEVAPAKSSPCFLGSYYRKAVSSEDVWTGIEAVVTLPKLTLDDARRDPGGGKHLDSPSVYVGGRAADQEIDCGVNWELIKEPNGTASKTGKAFRPFWRNKKWTTGPAKPEYYYYPGDTLRFTCVTTQADKLTIEIALLSRAGSKPATQNSKPISVLRETFDANHFGPGKMQQFKRVNAIDQRHNEGKPVQPTAAHVDDATWHEVWLLRSGEKRAMMPARFTDMRCPDEKFVKVDAVETESGGERVSLSGS